MDSLILNNEQIQTNIFKKRYTIFNEILDGDKPIDETNIIKCAILLTCIRTDGYIIIDPSILYNNINTDKDLVINIIKEELLYRYKKKEKLNKSIIASIDIFNILDSKENYKKIKETKEERIMNFKQIIDEYNIDKYINNFFMDIYTDQKSWVKYNESRHKFNIILNDIKFNDN